MRILPLIAIVVVACAAPIARAEAPIGARYDVQVRPNKDAAWQDQGEWVIGGRDDERPIELRLGSGNGIDVVGQVKYAQKEGMLGVKLRRVEGRAYTSATKAGLADHAAEGQWVIGTDDHTIKQLLAKSADGGQTLIGTITYNDGAPAEFKATAADLRYQIQVRQPSSQNDGEWQDRGAWVMSSPTGERPISMHIIARGNGAGGKVDYAHDKGSANVLLDPIEGRLFKAQAKTLTGETTDLGEWVLDDKPIMQVYATSADEGKILTGYIIFRGSPEKLDFKATLIDGLPDAPKQPTTTAAGETTQPAGSKWDGQFAHEGTMMTISENGSTLSITTGDTTMQGKITSKDQAFDGFVYSHGDSGDEIPVSGTYEANAVHLSIAGGEPIVHTATPAAAKAKPAE